MPRRLACWLAGASDDASCVGIVLELARTLIANPKIQLAAPVIFLMNGAEEALCPASHGFMQQSPWARDAGVFLNLESTGPLGPDFLFQQTGQANSKVSCACISVLICMER